MKTFKLILSAILLFVFVKISAQPKVSVEWTNSDGVTSHSCLVDDPLCGCSSMPPIDFGSLEAAVEASTIPLEKTIDVTFSNNGTGALAIWEHQIVTGAADNWEISYTPSFVGTDPVVLSGSSTLIMSVKLKPLNTAQAGPDILTISINTSGCAILPSCEVPSGCSPGCIPCIEDFNPSTSELELRLRLQGIIERKIVNFSLVLDRSGSMGIMEDDGVGGTEERIDILSDAVEAFINLAETRKENGDTNFDGDKLSMVKYDDVVDSYMVLETLTNASVLIALGKVEPDATNDPNRIEPRGLTATGDAVIMALEAEHMAAYENPEIPGNQTEGKVIILFSDGYENSGHRVDDQIVVDALGNRQDLFIYSLGMGDANNDVLEQYSNLSGLISPQFYPVTNSSVDLSLAYAKIYQDALNYEGVHDPVYHVNLMNSSITYVSEAMITSSERKAIFSIIHPRKIKGLATFQLISPSGKILSAGSSDGLETRVNEGRNHTIYHVVFTENANPEDYVGNWTLQITGISKERLAMSQVSVSNLTNVPIGFSVMAASNLTFDFNIGSNAGLPGDALTVSSSFTDRSAMEPVRIENFHVTIKKPDGSKDVLRPQMDQFGRFTATYPHTQQKGLYTLKAEALVRNSKGELATRDAIRYVMINTPQKYTSPDESCLSCNYIKAIIAITIILLIFILIIVVRRRRP